MRRYQLYANPFPSSRSFAPLVVVLSSHLLDTGRAVVAPLLIDAATALTDIHVTVDHQGASYVVAVHDLSSIDSTLLRRAVGTLESSADEIDRAVHRLFTGF